ncbi:hypothetical protein [Glutamicibacter arilaitensis]|uniref:hypothetical protein n=1 Tax=Glutamicibacter arilaitensis TaxID=256701 RepID=UPI003FD18F17
MARIRTIKPEFWDSPSTAKASPWARLLFIAMWNWADDYGRGTANLKELEGFAFPNDDDFKDSSGNTVHFRELVAEVSECFGVVLYEVDNRRYYEIPSWDTHQRNERRSKQSKYPSPLVSGHKAEMPEGVAEIPYKSTETPNISGTGTGEQGNRGTGEQGNRGTESTVTLSDADAPDHEPEEFELTEEELPIDDVDTTPGYPADFTRFWEIYPRRGGKGAACTAFIKAKKRANVETIITGAERLRDDPNLPEGKLIPMPSTWLNQDRWEDDPLPSRADLSKSEQRLQQGFDLVQRVASKGKGGLDCDPFERKEITS